MYNFHNNQLTNIFHIQNNLFIFIKFYIIIIIYKIFK